MRSAGNFSPEWGYLAPAPSVLRTVRVVLVATAIGATAGAGVVLSLIDRPAGDADRVAVAAHAIVTSAQAAPAMESPRVSTAAFAAPAVPAAARQSCPILPFPPKSRRLWSRRKLKHRKFRPRPHWHSRIMRRSRTTSRSRSRLRRSRPRALRCRRPATQAHRQRSRYFRKERRPPLQRRTHRQ